MAQIDADALREFVAESREHLATIEADLLAIEEAGAAVDEDLVNKVFRAAHSIKGGAGFFGLARIKELAHKAETVLDLIRSRKLTPNADVTNLLLAGFDKLREMIGTPGASDSVDDEALLISLTDLAGAVVPSMVTATGTELPVVAPEDVATAANILPGSSQFVYQVDIDLSADVEQRGRSLAEFFRALRSAGVILECEVDAEACGLLDAPENTRLSARIVYASRTRLDPGAPPLLLEVSKVRLMNGPADAGSPAAQPTAITPGGVSEPAVTRPPPAAPPGAGERGKEVSATTEGTLRVSVDLLESLMNLAGELVLSRNQLRAVLAQSAGRAVQAGFQRINLVTSELQDAIMHTRMQPIGNVFGKFPRVVRDMARSLKKEIQLDIRGKAVGLDKSLIEGLSDPLTHMVRNAVDHGIETVEDRLRAGKRASGTLRIEARHEAGQVVVEIADDGKGIDPNKIASVAIKRGLVSQEAVQAMTEQEKMMLIFLPGLSTAEKVTDVSGRGVGMDVVKTNLSRLGGKVEIVSKVGQGTLFRIKLPLTLAIIPSLVVSVNDERFAIPQISVVELLRIRAEKIKERVEVIGEAEVLVLRDELIPIVRFADALGIQSRYDDPATGKGTPDRRVRLADRRSRVAPGSRNVEPDCQSGPPAQRQATDRRQSASSDLEIVVVTTGTMKYGLVVDHFHTGEEIVVKPLGRHLKGLSEYAGATIMGDGTVALIVDVAGLAVKAQLMSTSGVAQRPESESAGEASAESRSLLLFHNAPEELCATPLENVVRVERVTPKQVETVGGKRTMQYRGAFLPLVTLADVARVGKIIEAQDLAVIVTKVGQREIGLLAAMPVDVVDTTATVDSSTHRQTGIAGSAIVRDITVLVVNVLELAQATYPEWNLLRDAEPAHSDAAACQIMVAEDSDFFRAQVRRCLQSAGFSVLEAEDGEVAWRLLQENADTVRALVTDMEMPNLGGLGLTSRVRQDPRFGGQFPIIALTSLAGEEDVGKGRAAGVDDYQIKLDREQLIASLRALLLARGTPVPSAPGSTEAQESTP